MQPTIIGLLGKPLSGKDTVARLVGERDPHVATISFGAIINEVKSTGENHRFWPLLHETISIADSGGIVPGEPINTCMEQLVSEQIAAGKTRIIWIAGPRNMEELDWLDHYTKTHDIKEQFIHINVPDEDVVTRLRGRNEGRADDALDVLPVRLRNFREITKPVIDRLRDEGRLTEISGTGNKEMVGRQVIEALEVNQVDPEITLPAMARK